MERLAGPQRVVKAMEDTWVPGAGVDEPSGVGEWNGQMGAKGTGEALLGPSLRATEACRPITGDPGKWSAAERESEGVVVAVTGGTTEPAVSEGPLLHRCTTKGERNADECRCVG